MNLSKTKTTLTLLCLLSNISNGFAQSASNSFGARDAEALSLRAVAPNPNAPTADPLPNLVKVNDTLYRGGRPSLTSGLQQLKSLGVVQIINIDNDTTSMAAEKKAAEKLGMAWVSFPMSAWSAPTDQDVDQMLALLQQNGHGIIYLHCKHGQDRTGLIMGLYRFFADKWTAPQAWDEMLKLGYHTLFTEMTDYFEKRTHWNGPVGTF